MNCTIYKNTYTTNEPFTVSVKNCLNRIQSGKSKVLIEKIRAEPNKDKRDAIKTGLPSVLFSGVFGARRDSTIKEYSNLIILDFDDVENIEEKKKELASNKYTYAVWLSPSGHGLKSLVKVSDGRKHKEHFLALEKEFGNIDKSGKNISRICYESYDPEIYINENSEVFSKILIQEVKTERVSVDENEDDVYEKLKIWLSNKSESFVSGNRNFYIFKLASACCRLGINENSALDLIIRDYGNTNFSHKEIGLAIKSAYKSSTFGEASFKSGELITTATEKIIDVTEFKAEDFKEYSHVIFGDAVKSAAMKIYEVGYEKLNGINTPIFDHYYKSKRGEVNLWTGYGNMGKSTQLKWFLLNRAVLYGEKYALFDPEADPAEESYLEFVEMLAGCDCTPANPNRPSVEKFEEYYDFVSEHFYYIYPKTVQPTLVSLLESFLELVIKQNISGFVIDPFNQMYHDRGKITREDFYLEETLSKIGRFASQNNVFAHIVAHPTGNPERNGIDFKAPDMYKVSGGAMWANKMHNILIYHRPKSRSEPDNPIYDLVIDKIKKKKITGKTGNFQAQYFLSKRRFIMPFWDSITKDGDFDRCYDPLENNIKKAGLFQDNEVKNEEPFKIPNVPLNEAFGERKLTPEEQDEQMPY